MRLAVCAACTALFVLLQSTVLHVIAFHGVIPDLSLIAVIFIANRNGPVFGQSAGFIGGLVEDFLSLSPLGFHALLKTVIGFCAGMSFGAVFFGSLFMPMLMAGAASIVKNFMTAILMAIISDSASANIFSWATLIEIVYNMILAPFVFALLGFIKILVPKVRG